MSIEKILYTATATATGGREGQATSSDGVLDVKLTTPRELGGAGGDGTNPEQLFAAGYSACFIGAMKAVAAKQGIKLPEDLSIDAEVDLGPVGQAYGVAARLTIHLPGMEREAAQKLIDTAHMVCPYSNATRGNIPVTLTLA